MGCNKAIRSLGILVITSVFLGLLSPVFAAAPDTGSTVFFVSWPGYRVQSTVLAEQLENLPASQRAVAAIKSEGTAVAGAIKNELPAEVLTETIWAARGLIAHFPSPVKLAFLKKEYPHFTWESLAGFKLREFPAKNVAAEQAERIPHFWNLDMSGAQALRTERNLTGKGVLIGVLGIDSPYMHPVLKGKISYYKEVMPAPTSHKEVADLQLMHPLGVLAGNHPDLDLSVAPKAKIALATIARGSLTAEHFLQAMQWLLEPEDRVSPKALLLGLDFSGTVPKAVRELLNSCRTAGILPIIPAGNNPNRITGMAALPECMTVGALDQWGNRALFSGQGPVQIDQMPVIKPDLMEPGVSIYGPSSDPKEYRFGSGTLQAAAHFAGVWAQLREARPADDDQILLDALATTTKDLGAPGKDNETGLGLFNPSQALYVIENPPPPPTEEPY